MTNKPDAKTYEPPTIKHTPADAPVDPAELVLIFSIEKDNPDYDPNATSHDGANPAKITDYYTMPRKPNVGLGLAYLKMARQIGTELAGSWLIETALGEDAYDALAAEKDLDPAELASIIDKVQKTALGGLEGPKGS